jgi:hypothetical protein
MQPNDLPIVCLPLELSDEAVVQLIAFLRELTEALERHYAGQLLRHAHPHRPASPSDTPVRNPHDPPF